MIMFGKDAVRTSAAVRLRLNWAEWLDVPLALHPAMLVILSSLTRRIRPQSGSALCVLSPGRAHWAGPS